MSEKLALRYVQLHFVITRCSPLYRHAFMHFVLHIWSSVNLPVTPSLCHYVHGSYTVCAALWALRVLIFAISAQRAGSLETAPQHTSTVTRQTRATVTGAHGCIFPVG
jgi:hypothetical protein